MIFYGLQKTTLLDYPAHVAATLFTGGCNFKCPYCHNYNLISPKQPCDTYSEEEILSFLQHRQGILQGVCITGGEPTLLKSLPEFIQKVKNLSLKVKLDTNGSNPVMLKNLIENQLIDYVAMDIKTSPSQYHVITGSKQFTPSVLESVELLKNTSIPYEFRTTIVKELHTDNEILEIGKWLEGCEKYFLQTYKDNPEIPYLLHAHNEETMEHFASLARTFIPTVSIR
jgi:pyruvate formate lyase activating enzyme